MKDAVLKELLERADQGLSPSHLAPLPPGAGAELAARLIGRAARRARGRRLAGMMALAVVCAGLLLSVLRVEPREAKVASNGAGDTTRLRAELVELEGEAKFHLKVARAVAKAEAIAKRRMEGERGAAEDPVGRIEAERELAAAVLMREADRLGVEPGRAEQARARYERVVRMFPDTGAASEARRRLDVGV